MAKLTGTNRETILAYCRSVERMPSYHAVQFVCTDNAGGKAVKDVINRVYRPKECVKGNTIAGFVFTAGGLLDNWRVFRAKFNSDDEADRCLADINNTLNEGYGADDYKPGSSGTSGDSGSDGKGGNGEATNYTTYIIIGAAVLLIVLLLMKRKGK